MRMAYTLALVACLVSTSGCLGEAGSEVYALRAIVTTGNEGTDGNVKLCWTVEGQDECHELSSSANDFERGARQTFDVRPKRRWDVSVTPTAIWLQYSPGLSIGDKWQLASLTVIAYGTDDSQRTLCQVSPNATVSSKVTCL